MSKLFARLLREPGTPPEYVETGYSEEQFDRLIKDRDRLLVLARDLFDAARQSSQFEDGRELDKLLTRARTELLPRFHEVEAARSRLPNSGEPDKRG